MVCKREVVYPTSDSIFLVGRVIEPRTMADGLGLEREAMLSRHRVLLALLQAAGGKSSHLQLTKWAFLLSEEGRTRGGSAFYRFVPYRHGPFSFSLMQEAGSLVRDGLIEEVDERNWAILPEGGRATAAVPKDVRNDVHQIARRYSSGTVESLVRDVYDRFPWYTVNSVRDPRARRPKTAPAIYTVGYESLSVDAFLDGLLRRGIEQVVDVRHNPVSRRYGFHKSTLARLCGKLEIAYEHVPELGIDSATRRDIGSEQEFEEIFERYKKLQLPAQFQSVRRVAEMVSGIPSVLVCMERAPSSCHRSRLAEQLASLLPLPVEHLEIER